MADDSSSKKQKRSRGRPSRKQAEVAPEDELLRLALELFAETGYEGTSIRRLTGQLGVSHSLLHARYGSKEKLWKAAVDFGMKKLVAQTQHRLADAPRDLPVTEKIRILFEDFLSGVSTEPAVLRLMNYEGSRSSARLDYIATNFLQGRDDLEALMSEGKKAGMIRDVPTSMIFFLMAHGAGSYFGLQPLARHVGVPARQSIKAVQADIETLAEMLLLSIRTDQH